MMTLATGWLKLNCKSSAGEARPAPLPTSMTNNVEIDDRGFIYVVDRNGAGLDILQLTGKALDIAFPAARPLR